jgi:phosphoribosyl 1,2-cyclic phosphate phosphodiesterase
VVCASTDPRDRRWRSSLLIRSGSTAIAIDCGPDFREQMLREKVDRLDAVVLTHEHRDHLAGIDDLRVFNYHSQGDFPLYCTHAVEEQVRQGWRYAFKPSPYPGIPQLGFVPIENERFTIGELHILPIPVLHYRLPVLGFRIGPFAYITDVSHIPDSSFQLLEGVDTIVLGALRKTPHLAHFSLTQAMEAARKTRARQAYFIHMSHDMGLHRKVEAELPPGMNLSYDGLTLHFGR